MPNLRRTEPTSSLDDDDLTVAGPRRAAVAAALATAFDHGGPTILFEPARLEEALVRDAGDAPLEIELVVAALDDQLPQQMLAAQGRGEWPAAHARFVDALVDRRGIDAGPARWIVAAWADALALPSTADADEAVVEPSSTDFDPHATDPLFAPTVPMAFLEDHAIAQPWATGRETALQRSAAPLMTSLGSTQRVTTPGPPNDASSRGRREPLIAQVGRAAMPPVPPKADAGATSRADHDGFIDPIGAADEDTRIGVESPTARATHAATSSGSSAAPTSAPRPETSSASSPEPFVARRDLDSSSASLRPPSSRSTRRKGRIAVGIVVGLAFAVAFYILDTRPDLLDAFGDHPPRISPTLPRDRTRPAPNAEVPPDAASKAAVDPASKSASDAASRTMPATSPSESSSPVSRLDRTTTQESSTGPSTDDGPTPSSPPQSSTSESSPPSEAVPPSTAPSTSTSTRASTVPSSTAPPRITRIDVPRIVAGRSFQVALRVEGDASRAIGLERRIVGSDVTWPTTLSVTPIADLVRTSTGSLLASFAPIARASTTTVAFALVDRDGARSASKTVTLRAVDEGYAPADAASPASSPMRSSVDCSRADCGTVSSATRAEVGTRADALGSWDVTVRMDDRTTATFPSSTPWPAGTRVQRRGDRFVPVER